MKPENKTQQKMKSLKDLKKQRRYRIAAAQITVSFIINSLIILAAAMIFDFLNQNQQWTKFQKWLMGFTLSVLAVKLILTKQPAH